MSALRLPIALLAAAGVLVLTLALVLGPAGASAPPAHPRVGVTGVSATTAPPPTATTKPPTAPPPTTATTPAARQPEPEPGGIAVGPGYGSPAAPEQAPPAQTTATKPSRALGQPFAGRLRNGVVFPVEGPDWFTWDDIDGVAPNPDWRRVGTDTLVAFVPRVLATFRRQHPDAPRIGIQDMSLPYGGPFGPEYGGLGHSSHQNGLDVDIAYPRRDRREVGDSGFGPVDKPLAQALVDAFVKAGAQYVFVGPHTGLKGKSGVVEIVAYHDDHMHVRLFNPHPADVKHTFRRRSS